MMATNDKYYHIQKKRVIKQKKKNEVKPQDLYRLAALLLKWKPNDKLPVCLLCQNVAKTPTQRGHLIPHSILKEAGRDKFLDFIRGTEVRTSKVAYYAFCPDCEGKFQQGENHLNPKFFKLLFHDTDREFKVTAHQDDGFPWLFYSCISIVWRTMCFIPLSFDFVPALECLRKYLLDWRDSEQIRKEVQLFILAPNGEIDNLIKCNDPANHKFFYEMYHARFNNKPKGDEPKGRMAWIFCGPMHIVMVYQSKWYVPSSMLTTKTTEFTVRNKTSRFFPVEMYSEIVSWGKQMLSSITRLPVPPGGQVTASLGATHLHLLPKDVSYDIQTDTFGLPSWFHSVRTEHPYPHVTIVKASKGGEKFLFTAVRGALSNGGHVAEALKINSDETLSYMAGAEPKQGRYSGPDLTEPPFKKDLESLCRDLGLL